METVICIGGNKIIHLDRIYFFEPRRHIVPSIHHDSTDVVRAYHTIPYRASIPNIIAYSTVHDTQKTPPIGMQHNVKNPAE